MGARSARPLTSAGPPVDRPHGARWPDWARRETPLGCPRTGANGLRVGRWPRRLPRAHSPTSHIGHRGPVHERARGSQRLPAHPTRPHARPCLRARAQVKAAPAPVRARARVALPRARVALPALGYPRAGRVACAVTRVPRVASRDHECRGQVPAFTVTHPRPRTNIAPGASRCVRGGRLRVSSRPRARDASSLVSRCAQARDVRGSK